jgi:hypothetical protein
LGRTLKKADYTDLQSAKTATAYHSNCEVPSVFADLAGGLDDVFEVEHQRKMGRYDRLMRDLRGKVRIGAS